MAGISDLLDRAFGEAKDPVLRNRQGQRDRSRQPGIEPAQHAADQTVRDHDAKTRPAGLAQPIPEPRGKGGVALAVRGAEIPVVAPVAIENAGAAPRDIGIGQPVPGAERQLAQPIVDLRFADQRRAARG